MTDRPRRLLFVCSGNLCRSPMAAVIAESLASEVGLDVETRSAGTLGLLDRPAEPRAVAVCREIGLDLSAHRSRALTADLVRWADAIYVMEDVHALAVRELVPDVGEIVVQLGPLVGKPAIPDPMGSWFKRRFRETREDLKAALVRAFGGVRKR